MRRLPILLILPLILFLNLSIATSTEDAGLLKNLPGAIPKKLVLDNGLTIILKEVPSSGLVSIDARVKAGSAYEGEFSGSGISHFVEHMVFKGTPKRKPGQIEKEIRSLGGRINGATTLDYTSFTITVPKKYLSEALEILSDSLFNADINPSEMEKERRVILKEIRLNRDDPMRYASRLLWSSVFKTHPYRYPIIGYESLFRKLARRDLLAYYKKMYIPNNMVLAVVGDIEKESALTEIKNHFQHIERASLEERVLPQEKVQGSKRILEAERELQMAYFTLGYRSVDVCSQDMPALDVLSVILGQGESSRLNANVYRKKNLVYSIGSWNYTPGHPGIFIISGLTEPKKLKSALGAIKEEVNNIKSGGVDDHELQRAKAMIIANYIYSLQTLSDQARDLATNEILTGDFGFTKKYLENINSVRAEDIDRVAGLYLNNEALSLITLSSAASEVSAQEDIKIVKKDIQKFTLPNGLKCLLMEDHSLPTVSMIAVWPAGLRAETEDTSGISNLTALMTLKGTLSKSEEEISDLIESLGARLSFFSGNNTLGIRLNLLSKDLNKGLELFEDIILNPTFPPEVLQREKTSVMASIKATDDDLFRAGLKAFKEMLFKRHPYRFQTVGTISSISELTKGDLEEFYKKYFIPNNMVLAIFGDISSKMLQENIYENFSALKRRPAPEFTAVREQEQSGVRQNLISAKKEQSLVIMGFKGTTINSKDRYTLQLISAALSGLSGRLAARLREDLGMAYAVGSFSVPGIDPGYFALYISTTNSNIERARKEFYRQIKLLNKKGLSAEEIDSAKKELIGNQRIALQTNTALAYQTALDELYGLGYNHYQDYPNIINSITNRDIMAASRRYLKPGAFTLIIMEGQQSYQAGSPEGKRGG